MPWALDSGKRMHLTNWPLITAAHAVRCDDGTHDELWCHHVGAAASLAA